MSIRKNVLYFFYNIAQKSIDRRAKGNSVSTRLLANERSFMLGLESVRSLPLLLRL